MNILLVRLRLIGDVVFTTPLIAALRRHYPLARLTYLVEASAAPVVEQNPHLAEVIITTHTRGWTRLRDDVRLARRLRRARYDVAIDLHGGPRSGWLTWASRAPVRVGYDVPGRSWMYTRVVARPKSYRPRHAVENQWALLSALSPACGPPSRDTFPVQMWPSADDSARATRFLADAGVSDADRVILLHVSAGNPFRRWPEAAFANAAAELVRAADNRTILVTAGPSDRDAATRVVAQARLAAGSADRRILLADNVSLGVLRALLDRAALFIGGDSGPLHVAATSRAPIVGIYGPTRPERSAPWRPAELGTADVEPAELPCRPCDQRTCLPGDFRCLSTIPPQAVRDAAERLLARPTS